MTSSLRQKIKMRGAKWFLQRVYQELCAPRTFSGRLLAFFLKKLVYWFFIKPVSALAVKKNVKELDALLLIYDLQVEPITFNFIWALVIADYQRQQRGLSALDVMIIKGNFNGLRQEEATYEKACTVAARHWRIQSILFGALNLIPSFRNSFYIDRAQIPVYLEKYQHRYPEYYSFVAPASHRARDAFVAGDIRSLQADPESLRLMRRWLNQRAQGRKIITITLRQSVYYPERNSNFNAWLEFAKTLDNTEYFVVFIPDTEVYQLYSDGKIESFTCCTEASINIQLRMALYELSTLCLGINNGPMSLCWFSQQCNYIMFRVVSENAPQTSTTTLAQDFTIGATPSFARGNQLWIWQDDEFSVIQKAVKQLIGNFCEAQG